MKRIRTFIIVLFAVSTAGYLSMASAGEKLNKEQVRQLITDNTVDEVFTEKSWQNKIYFTSDGKFKRIDQNGNPDSGKWDFDPDGSLCLERKKRKCWFLEAAEKDVYHVISRRRGQHAKTWHLLRGNPYNL
jgi:hypothetical protein